MGEFSVVVLSLAGCVFTASATAKLRGRQAHRSFRDGLGETKLIPLRLLPTVAAVLSAAEVVIAAGLVLGAGMTVAMAEGAALLAESALAAAAVLTAVLAIGVAVVVRRGTRARCACFGSGAVRQLGRVHLARNLCLLTVICAGLAGIPLARGHATTAGAVLAAPAGAVAALLFIRWDDLVGLFLPIAGAPAPAASHTPTPTVRQLADGGK